MHPLGVDRTAASGRFDLPYDLRSLPKAYVDQKQRSVDVAVIAEDKTRSISWQFTVAVPEASGSSAKRVRLRQNGKPVDTRFDIGTSTVVESSDDPRTWIGRAGGAPTGAEVRHAMRSTVSAPDRALSAFADAFARADEASRARLLDPSTTASELRSVAARTGISPITRACNVRWLDNWKKGVDVRFLTVYAAGTIPATVESGIENSVSMTVGVVLQGSDGALSAAGTDSKSFSASGVQTGIADANVFNKVNYREQTFGCSQTKWRVYNGFDVLTEFTRATHVEFNASCTARLRGATWATQSATAKTISGGVSFPGWSVSAQSGFGKSQKVTFNFNSAGVVCGNSDLGPLQSSRIDARVTR